MRILIVIDHPWPKSFNHGILKRVVEAVGKAGNEPDVLDLHRDGFNPVMSQKELSAYSRGAFLDSRVGDYQKRIEIAGHLVFIFPVWWEVMPAMLKGFFDKVFLPDWAFNERDASPRLSHISGATVITTMGAPRIVHTSVEPVLCRGILKFSGVGEYRWFNLCDMPNTTLDERNGFLKEIEAHLLGLN
jgi:putative NADPH-quinone reductase